jgi:eukaryotic-like serine/threonine-protein kinase
MQLAEGQVLAGRYRLVKLLGEGGMGAVWEAVHLITLKPVAMKFLKSGAGDTTIKERFFREARAASAVRHPNVVQIHDVVELDGDPFMIMDLLEGESLEALLERQPKLSVRRTSWILGYVVAAVRAAHAVGIVHRDLKPANIFLSRERDQEVVRVLDFGIAKILEDVGAKLDGKLTSTGAVLGTPYYMPPEQLWGEVVDTRADVWALGVVLYECLAGRRPIEGENMGQLLKAVAMHEPLGQVDPALPASLTDIVTRMLQSDRTDRLADLEIVATELKKYAEVGESARFPIAVVSTGPAALGVDPLAITNDKATKMQTASALSAESPPPVRARRVWPILAAAIGAVSVAVGLYVWRAAPASTSAAHVAPLAVSAPPPSAPAITSASSVDLVPGATASNAVASAMPAVRPRAPRVTPSASAAASPQLSATAVAPKPSAGVGVLHAAPPF